MWSAQQIHHFKGSDARTKKMAGGGKLVGEHGVSSEGQEAHRKDL